MSISKKSWLFGIVGGVIGCALFAADTAIEFLGPEYLKTHYWVELLEFCLIGPGLGVLCLLLAERMITLKEAAKLQHENEQERRFQILGRMAASVAHEVRNPLHSLRLVVDELRLEKPDLVSHPLSPHIDSCLGRIDKAVELVYQLARHKIDDDSSGDFVATLREAIAMMGQSAPKHQFESGGLPERALARAAPAAQRIMLDNLLRNAVEATPNGCVISLTVQVSDGHLVVQVSNPGSLPKNEDFKSSQKESGLGLGLLITHQLAQNAGGNITLRSSDGQVTAKLTLPMLTK
jgi:two-component system, sporulation sensor kinase B